MQEAPGLLELLAMNLGPRLNQALLGLRQTTRDALDRVDREHRFRILIHRVEVRPMVRRPNLHEHANDDPEKPRQLWHVVTLHRPRWFQSGVWHNVAASAAALKFRQQYTCNITQRIISCDSTQDQPRDWVLALVCGLPTAEWRNRRVAVVRAFVDDSGSGGDSRYYVLAGFVATIPTWCAFTDAWQEVLDQKPKLGYFKMAEANALNGQFGGWAERQRNIRVNDLITVIENHDLYEASTVVAQADYDEVLKPFLKDSAYNNPYLFAFGDLVNLFASSEMHYRHAIRDVPSNQIVVISENKSITSGGPPQKVDFVFDEQKNIERQARHFYDLFKDVPPYKDRIENIDYGDDKKFLPLQAADLTAWQHRRRLCAVVEGTRPEYERLHKNPLRFHPRRMIDRSDLLKRREAIERIVAGLQKRDQERAK